MGPSVEDLDAAIKTYVEQVKAMDVVAELKEQVERLSSKNGNIDWVRVESRELLYISSVFDLSEWWHVVGRKTHEIVFRAVPLIISIPSSNGYQERVFSACTYFDSILRQNLKDERFERKVLMAVNEHLMDDLNSIDPVVHWTGVASDYSDPD